MKFDDYTTLPETNIAPQYGRVGSWKTSFLFLGDGFLTGANGVTFQRYTSRGYYLRDPKKGILIFQSSFFRVYFLNFKGCICLGIVYINIIIYIYYIYGCRVSLYGYSLVISRVSLKHPQLRLSAIKRKPDTPETPGFPQVPQQGAVQPGSGEIGAMKKKLVV